MDVSVLICTIFFYILSLVGALLLSMSGKKFDNHRIKQLIQLHFSAFAATVLFFFILPKQLLFHSSFLLTCCTGVAFSGLMLRNKQFSPFLRFYFGAYLFTIVLFIYSPSLLFYVISGNIGLYSPNQEIKLKENCYLVRQQSMLSVSDEKPLYKVLKKYGIYNKTLARNLNFTKKIDSIRIIVFNDDTVVLTGYLPDNDSAVVGFRPGMRESITTIHHGK